MEAAALVETVDERQAIQHEAEMARDKLEETYHEACARLGLTNMSTVRPESVRFLWHPYIPLGKVTLLDGDPGLGKSFITLSIATAVSRGHGLPFEGRCDAGDVLLLSAEDGLADTIRPRLDRMQADCNRIVAVSKRLTLDHNGFSDLQRVLEKNRPRLVVIDPLFAYTGAKVDIHRANETRAFMEGLSRLAADCGCAILCVRHLTKGGRDKSIYRGVGSIDLVAACRSVLLAGADAEDRDKRAMLQIKNNLAPLGDAIGYEIREGGFAWTGKSDLTADRILARDDQSSKMDVAEDFLRQQLADGPMPSAELQARAKEARISQKTLWRAKDSLKIQAHKVGSFASSRWAWELLGDCHKNSEGSQ